MTIDEEIAHAKKVAKEKMTEYESHYDKDAHYYPRQCKRCAEEHEQLAEWLEELKKYRAIGTVEECRAAAEKQKTKRADLSVDGHSDGDMVCGTYECPYCGEYYELGYDEYEYCPNCGQHMKIDLEGDGNE